MGKRNMQDTDDSLLNRIADHRDEAAFKTLAGRYLGLIYHTALRRTGNRQLAEEVSQNVLCAMAKKARGLAKDSERLSAWLHRATVFESTKAMRAEASQQRRKLLRHPDEIAATGGEAAWAEMLPHLDPALDRLPDSDRRVVLQHYFEGRSFSRIGEQQGRPAATVQKQCRRAIDKLARMLRGKGVALTTAAFASGLGTQLAKAALPGLLNTIAGPALTGTAAYSTTGLTLFMTAKSKAALPIALLVLLTPLALQQLAISRAEARNEDLRLAFGGDPTAASTRPARPASGSVAAVSRRITIDVLSRALDEANRQGSLKEIEFHEMIVSLDADQLAELIPQAVNLPEPQQKRARLLTHLLNPLTKLDPERAVKVTLAADRRGQIAFQAGIAHAVHVWAEQQPDEAFVWLRDLAGEHAHVPAGEDGFAWDRPFGKLHAAVLGVLVMNDSPRVREAILLAWNGNRGSLLQEAVGDPTRQGWMDYNWSATADDEEPAGPGVGRFAKFVPWIREFLREGDESLPPKRAIQGLLQACESPSERERGDLATRVMESVELLPAERRWIAEDHASAVLRTGYNPNGPDRAEAEASARDWLETHLPEAADEVLAEARRTVHEQLRLQTEHDLRRLAEQDGVQDSDLILILRKTNFRALPEFLPLGLEQAKHIKDPTKREEMFRLLESQIEKR